MDSGKNEKDPTRPESKNFLAVRNNMESIL